MYLSNLDSANLRYYFLDMAPIRLGNYLFNVDSLVPEHYLISMDLARPGNYLLVCLWTEYYIILSEITGPIHLKFNMETQVVECMFCQLVLFL